MAAESEVTDRAEQLMAEMERLRAEIERRAAGRGAPMSMQNGNGASDAEMRALIDRIDAEDARGERDELKQHQKELERRLAAIATTLEELTANTRPKLTRSAMSAADKSRYIRAHGLPSYQKLPWI
jgi:uncharacterized membrane protein YccC